MRYQLLTQLPPRIWLLMMLASGFAAIHQTFFLPQQTLLARYIDHAPLLATVTLAALIVAASINLTTLRAPSRISDALFSGSLILVIALLVPGRALIEADAAHLVATSQGILATGSALAPSAGIYDANGALVVTQMTVDKRGVMFPIALVAMHSIFGFDADHALSVNLLAGWASFFLLIRLTRRFVHTNTAPMAAVLAAALPLISIHIRCGTFDIANLACLLLLIHSAISFFADPQRKRFWLMVTAGSVAAQLRYESAALAGLIVGVAFVCIAWRIRFSPLRTGDVWIAPWFFVATGLRRVLPFDYELPNPHETAWSFENLAFNAGTLGHYVVGYATPATSGNIVVFALAALGFATVLLRRGRGFAPLLMMAACLCGLTLLQLCYFWGTPILGQTARYFLPFAALAAMLATVALAAISSGNRMMTIIISTFALLYSVLPARGAKEFVSLTYANNTASIAHLWDQSTLQCDRVIVTRSALPLLVRGFSVIPSSAAKTDPTAIEAVTQRKFAPIDVPDLYVTGKEALISALEPPSQANCPRHPEQLRFDPRLPAIFHF